MLKPFYLAVSLFVLIPFPLTETALAVPLSREADYGIPASDPNLLSCYIQLPEGRLLDLSRLCGNKPDRPPISEISAPVTAQPLLTPPFAPSPIASGNAPPSSSCYFVDASGKPCSGKNPASKPVPETKPK